MADAGINWAAGQKPCPSCGHCPTCGHAPVTVRPWPQYPTYWPYWQVPSQQYPYPTTTIWSTTSSGATGTYSIN